MRINTFEFNRVLQRNKTWRIDIEMHLNNSKKNTVTSFHQIKCSNRNITSLTMERYWSQLVLNKKFAILSEQNCRHTVILLNWPCFIIISSWWKFALEFYSLHWERECGRWRQKFPLRKAEPLESPPVGRKYTFWLVFLFLQKAPVWESNRSRVQ